MPSSSQSFRTELVACLQHLAAAPEVQVEYLIRIGVYPSADELALELHELAMTLRGRVTAGELSFAEKTAVERLDREIESFSGHENASLWTVDALASADQWKRIRAMASECLGVLGDT